MKLKDLIAQYGEQEVTNIYMNSDNSYGSITVKLEPPKPKTVCDLKRGDSYYCTDIDGEVIYDVWCESFQDEREMGNAFLTKEEAEKIIISTLVFGGFDIVRKEE